MKLKEAENLRDLIAAIENMGYTVRIETFDGFVYPKEFVLRLQVPGDVKA